MASNIPLNVHFDFEIKLLKSSGIRFLGGGVSDSRVANMLNPDACMADAEGDDNPLENHGSIDIKEFGRDTERVHALEDTLRNVNTNVTNLSTLFQ